MKKRFLALILSALMLALAIGATVAVALSQTDDTVDMPVADQAPAVEKLSADDSSFVWPDSTYQEKTDVDPYDTMPGSLSYTPSEDGSTVTITYETGTETHSYTVPNDNNYLFGGFAGTDDVGRTLHDSSEVGITGSKGEKYVGIFYFLWHGYEGNNTLYDLQKIIDENGLEVAGKASSGLYGNIYDFHWYAEPLYGYYHNDPWVMRKHAELLCNAGVDFLYFDATNNRAYVTQALGMMKILHELNEDGYDAPQVVFYTNGNSNSIVNEVYNKIYSKDLYPDTWFCIDGKPVIVATERSDSLRQSGSYSNAAQGFFNFKESQWPIEDPQPNGWPWMDFEWPQRVYRNFEGGEKTMNISIAQHSDNTFFSTSSLYGNYKNRGRSYGSTAAQIKEWTKANAKEYGDLYTADNSMTDYGYNFQAQWDHAINKKVQFALVTGWNEWIAQRQDATSWLGSSDKILFVDCASMEYSRDAEMMRGGYFDNYYMQLIYNIERFKGDAPVIVQDGRYPINVTGDFSQWDNAIVNYTDPSGDTVERNGRGYGDVTYTDTTGRNDIVSAKITGDTKNVYFYVKTVDTISKYDAESSWMQLYVDIDRDVSTGWYGYDYIINYKASDASTTTVAKYTGTDGAYGYTEVGTVSYRVSGNEMMIEVPQEMLGIENYRMINLEFKWADSDTTYETMEQFYTDGDVAPLGRLNYVYQTYIEGEQTPPTPETEPVTEPESTDAPTDLTESEPITSTTATAETTEGEPTDEMTSPSPDITTAAKGGCGSVITSATLITLMAAGAATVCTRKKKD